MQSVARCLLPCLTGPPPPCLLQCRRCKAPGDDTRRFPCSDTGKDQQCKGFHLAANPPPSKAAFEKAAGVGFDPNSLAPMIAKAGTAEAESLSCEYRKSYSIMEGGRPAGKGRAGEERHQPLMLPCSKCGCEAPDAWTADSFKVNVLLAWMLLGENREVIGVIGVIGQYMKTTDTSCMTVQ